MKLLIALGIAAFGFIVKELLQKPRVFISFDHSEDVKYKRLLQAWNANPKFKFEFDSRGPDIAIASSNDGVIKAALTKKLKQASHLLVLVGKESHKSRWMKWEIEKAKELKLKIVAVKISKANISPDCLHEIGTVWVSSFQRKRIEAALNQ